VALVEVDQIIGVHVVGLQAAKDLLAREGIQAARWPSAISDKVFVNVRDYGL
jgi:hypothetical protein